MMWKLKRLWRNIVRTYELARLTWNNCDCDNSEATDLFIWSLKRIVKHIEEHKNHVGWEYTVSRGNTLIKLGEGVYGEYYSTEYQGIMDELWGPITSYWDEKAEADGMAGFFNPQRPKAVTETQKRQCKEDEHRLFLESQAKQEKANRIYYKLLEHRLQWLWD